LRIKAYPYICIQGVNLMSSRFEYKKTKSSLYEQQNIRYWLPYIAIAAVLLTLLALTFEKVSTGRNRFATGLEDWHYILIIFIVPVPLLVLLLRSKLDTIIDEDGIMYRWSPYDKKFHLMHWSAVKEVRLLDMKREGLLWRWKKTYQKRFFLGSRYGLEVHMRNGHTALLSTRKPEEMQRALSRNAMEKFNQDASTVVFDYS
jgi:hypothetical protein